MNEHDEHDIARMDAESPAAHRVDAEKLRAAIETIKGEDAAILDALAAQERDDDPVAEAEARTPNADEAPEA